MAVELCSESAFQLQTIILVHVPICSSVKIYLTKNDLLLEIKRLNKQNINFFLASQWFCNFISAGATVNWALHIFFIPQNPLSCRRPLRSSSQTVNSALPSPMLNRFSKCHNHVFTYLQGWWLIFTSLGSLCQCLTTFLVKKFFHNDPPKPPLM